MLVSRPTTRVARAAVCAAAISVAAAVHPAPALAAPNLSSNRYLDELGRPTPYTQAKVNEFADQPYVPQDVANALRSAVNFFAGTGEEVHGAAQGVCHVLGHVGLVREFVDLGLCVRRGAAKLVEVAV